MMVILGVRWDSENKKTVNFYFMHSVFFELVQQICVTFLIMGNIAFVEFFITGFSADAVTSTTFPCSHP